MKEFRDFIVPLMRRRFNAFPSFAEASKETCELKEMQTLMHNKAGKYLSSAVALMDSAFAKKAWLHELQDKAGAAQAEVTAKHILATSLAADASIDDAKARNTPKNLKGALSLFSTLSLIYCVWRIMSIVLLCSKRLT